jgi:hypothetical protein
MAERPPPVPGGGCAPPLDPGGGFRATPGPGGGRSTTPGLDSGRATLLDGSRGGPKATLGPRPPATLEVVRRPPLPQMATTPKSFTFFKKIKNKIKF